MTGPMLAADLVNLAHTRWSSVAAAGILAEHEIRRSELEEEASDALCAWTAELRRVFDAADVGERCTAINEILDAGTSRVYVTLHDELRPHLHFVTDDEDVVARVRAVTAGGLAIFIVESEGARLGVCGRESCGMVFVDTSRNGRRAYCSARCGNYVAVTRHRELLATRSGDQPNLSSRTLPKR